MNGENRIWKYFNDQRKGKEANRLEQEALSDPFLHEALEGLTGTQGEHEQIVAKLHRQLREWQWQNKRRAVTYWWGAASFLLIGGIALWLLQTPVEEEMQFAAIPGVLDSIHLEESVQEILEQPVGTIKQQQIILIEESVVTADAAIVQSKEVVVMKSKPAALFSPTAKQSKGVPIVRGVVVDRKGIPLSGVSIVAGKYGVATDLQGRFQLRLDDTSKLITASFIGMKTQRLLASERENMRIILTEDPTTPNEAVVANYRENRKRTMISSSTIIERDSCRQKKINRYIADSLRYPPDAIRQKIEGEVILSLHFNRKGRLGRIKVTQKLSPTCDREAIRLLEEYPGAWDIKKESITIQIPFKLR